MKGQRRSIARRKGVGGQWDVRGEEDEKMSEKGRASPQSSFDSDSFWTSLPCAGHTSSCPSRVCTVCESLSPKLHTFVSLLNACAAHHSGLWDTSVLCLTASQPLIEFLCSFESCAARRPGIRCGRDQTFLSWDYSVSASSRPSEYSTLLHVRESLGIPRGRSMRV